MFESIQIRLEDAKKTYLSGYFLASSIYHSDTDLLLIGEVGAGKTTFMQGLAKGLGIDATISSPTYALEQRYHTASRGELLHIDLYRLQPAGAEAFIDESYHHPGIRCIEWANRLPTLHTGRPCIEVHLKEDMEGRMLTITFKDESLPDIQQIASWRNDVQLPEHIQKHCDAVGQLAETLGGVLLQRGEVCRPYTLLLAGKLHDLLRFVDFKESASPGMHTPTKDQERIWNAVRQTYKGKNHEEACAAFLQEKNYPILAEIIEVHGLHMPLPERTKKEQQLLFYADKRMMIDALVTLDERLADFVTRYGNGKKTEEAHLWHKEALEIEKHLFPKGAPV